MHTILTLEGDIANLTQSERFAKEEF